MSFSKNFHPTASKINHTQTAAHEHQQACKDTHTDVYMGVMEQDKDTIGFPSHNGYVKKL